MHPVFQNFVDGFKPATGPVSTIVVSNPHSMSSATTTTTSAAAVQKQEMKEKVIREDSMTSSQLDMEEAASVPLPEDEPARKGKALGGWHIQMIAIGGSIGTGLFVGSGAALAKGGPASLLIAFGLVGASLYCVMNALGELAVAFPVAGGFATHATRFLDPAWGFSMGWNYALTWIICFPLELVAASITIGFWRPDLSPAIFVSVFFFAIILINIWGTKAYGNAEVIFSSIKAATIVGFILFGVAIAAGAESKDGPIGFRYWSNPGPFKNGFKGLCSVMVNAAFAFSGTELVGLTASETPNPRKTLPPAIKQVFWRICFFYLGSLFIVGLILPYNFPGLLPPTVPTSTDLDTVQDVGHSPNASPFVLATVNAGITALPAIVNASILLAIISVANSSVFGGSRTLQGLAQQGQAPRFLAYIDRERRPLFSILATLCVGLLAYMACMPDRGATIFSWLLAFSGLSAVFTWISICLAHIRFRTAWKKQGHTLDELAFVSKTGTWGSYIAVFVCIFILAAQFWIGVQPFGFEAMSGGTVAQEFFQAYLCVPIMMVMYFVWKVLKKTKIVRCEEMDLDTGRSVFDKAALVQEERAERAEWGLGKRMWKIFC